MPEKHREHHIYIILNRLHHQDNSQETASLTSLFPLKESQTHNYIMPIEPTSNRPIPPGLANNTHWNDSGFAFAPNTNVLDEQTMPSEAAARARAVGLASIEASKKRDIEEPHQLVGPAPTNTAGQLLPLQSWMDKLKGKNKKNQGEGEVLDGQSVRTEVAGDVKGSKDK